MKAVPPASPSENTDRARPTRPRVVLALGFGGLLVFILAAGAGTLFLFDRVHAGEAQARRTFLSRLSALDQIRAQIYLSGTYVRDFLLSPDPAAAAAQSARLTGLERQTRSALQGYSKVLDPEEHAPFASLRSEIESYWRVLDATMAWSPADRNRLRYAFFYNDLIPRRTAMLQIADRIGSANEHSLNRAEERLAVSAESLRRSLMLTFLAALTGGLVLALFTIFSTLRLERELERRLSENASARADLQELSARLLRAQEDERRSLARELHDEIGQSLSAILIEAEGGECTTGTAGLRDHLAAIHRLAEKTVNEVRDLALLLRPSMLDDLGLVPALNWHAREVMKRTGLNVVVHASDGSEDLPDEHKTCIYRMVQEALSNAARHARARKVEVVVNREAELVRFTVEDDGMGFDTRSVRGLGLLGMEERARRLGGSVTIDSRHGRGTLITTELPVARIARRNGHEAYPNPVG